MANIKKHFKRKISGPKIAYYFHEEAGGGQKDSNHILPLVLRSLLWQFPTSSFLLKSPAEKYQKVGYNPNIYDIWEQLFLQSEEVKNAKLPFYTLIDGVEGVAKHESL